MNRLTVHLRISLASPFIVLPSDDKTTFFGDARLELFGAIHDFVFYQIKTKQNVIIYFFFRKTHLNVFMFVFSQFFFQILVFLKIDYRSLWNLVQMYRISYL